MATTRIEYAAAVARADEMRRAAAQGRLVAESRAGFRRVTRATTDRHPAARVLARRRRRLA